MATKEDDEKILREFSAFMMHKLDKARERQPVHWDDPICTGAMLSRELWMHVFKGDPVDVANFCMMLHARGERIQDFNSVFGIPGHKSAKSPLPE